ncbi:MAG: hypothetical protein HN919_13980 [Verrucomicrobia bacterium]|nr:hypothetical protein [Verrucomicrobiota bacterium]
MRFEVLLKYPFVLLTGFVVTFALTPVVRYVAEYIGMVDQPRQRHVHKAATATWGGIAVFLGFHVACFAIFVLPWAPFVGVLDAVWWWHFLLLSTLLLCIGLLDDMFDLKPVVKLAGQVVVALLAFHFDMRIGAILGMSLPGVVDMLLTVAWFVVIINAFNLIDGMDGLATGLALIAAIGLAGSFLIRHMPTDALVLIGLIGACLAFLRYNFHPATIFLGDGGSMFLGFLLASVALSSGGAKLTTVTTIAVPLLAVGIPLFDTVLAIWRRTMRRMLGKDERTNVETKAHVFSGDVDHVHHRLLRAGLSHRGAAGWLYALALGLVSVGLLSMMYNSHATGIYIVAFVAITYLVVRHLASIELWTSGQVLIQGLHRPGNHMLGVVAYPIIDVLSLGGALEIATGFAGTFDSFDQWKTLWVDQLPVWVGLPFLCMFMARTYSRVWSRARMSEFILLGFAILAGTLVATGLNAVTLIIHAHDLALQFILHGSLSVTLIVGLRSLPRAILDAMAGSRTRGTASQSVRRLLLIGASSTQATLFLINQGFRLANDESVAHVVGYIDNNRQLHGRYVGGQLVHGGIDQLENEIHTHEIDMLVVIDPLDDGDMQTVTTVADRNKVDVYAWTAGIRTIRKNRPMV